MRKWRYFIVIPIHSTEVNKQWEKNSTHYFYMTLFSINTKLHTIYLPFIHMFGSIFSLSYYSRVWRTDGRTDRRTEKHSLFIILIKKGRQWTAEREWYKPYQFEDPSPTIPSYTEKEEKGRNSRGQSL